MDLHNLSNQNLESRLKRLVKTERKITHLVLQCIAEIDRRKLYLEKAYSSLFEFLVQEHGYSPSAAARRIDGARLLQQIPEVAEQLESGSVNLSQVALLQRADRELKREMGSAIPLEIKRDLLAKIENQSQVKSEQLIAQTLNIDLSPKNKTIHHKNESVTLTVTLTREQMDVLEQVQAMSSHAVPEKNWASLITHLAKKELARRTPKIKSTAGADLGPQSSEATTTATVVNTQSSEAITTAMAAKPRTGKLLRTPISQSIKKKLLHSQPQCTFRDAQTGKICGIRHFLQVDHIQSVSGGGGNNPENLQVLCGQHNRYKFTQEVRNRKKYG